jgi:hypothetical protein
MTDWTFAEQKPSDELAQLHFFSMQKIQDERSIEFRIAVYEYATKNHLSMRFFAQADRQTNQKTLPFTPVGWGQTLLQALAECIQAVHRFPYEGD